MIFAGYQVRGFVHPSAEANHVSLEDIIVCRLNQIILANLHIQDGDDVLLLTRTGLTMTLNKPKLI